MSDVQRCSWCGADPQYVAYHDQEWGVPVRDDVALFNKLMLDAFQSGLSWLVVLRKRAAMVNLLDLNEPERLARWSPDQVDQVLQSTAIIRNRSKVEACISNAQALCALWEEGRSLSDLLWAHVQGRPVVNCWTSDAQIPAKTSASDAMAKELKALGFRWTGPTVCYAFMQAVGMVNDHLLTCFRHAICSSLKARA
ncbi:MAG: DNA-3-methyladenine glycosylase I [Phycisphaerales bacterium]|nr:DNA-3-methyladenine glycosylase I [Phycisphaerales bacterium]